uniref:Uncharacterized protein n=1 Tax=Arundo donax TaxID=35708 RepID=A0A0A8ZBP4_ARUDO
MVLCQICYHRLRIARLTRMMIWASQIIKETWGYHVICLQLSMPALMVRSQLYLYLRSRVTQLLRRVQPRNLQLMNNMECH